MPVLETGAATLPAGDKPILPWISTYRWGFFALVGLILVLSFNGQWRVGRDSAAYRGLAHRLATTGQYVFRDKPADLKMSDQQDTRYPGLPIMLAVVERASGNSDRAAVLSVMVTAALTLVLTYLLMRSVLPLWVAVTVTFNLGINARFLEHANEILSDLPFLAGVMLSLLAFDRLIKA